MSKYYMFLKNNLIDFEKLIIDKYSFLGLDEVEVIILVKLHKLLSTGNKFSIDYISKNMTVSETIIRDKLVTLINNQFITLKLVDKSEIYSLDDTFKRLAELLENEEVDDIKNEINEDIKKIVSLLEKEFNKMLTPLELEIVYKWINDDKFSYDKIYEAVLETLKYKKNSIQYVDVLLNKKETPVKSSSNDGLQDLFNQVYGKIK